MKQFHLMWYGKTRKFLMLQILGAFTNSVLSSFMKSYAKEKLCNFASKIQFTLSLVVQLHLGYRTLLRTAEVSLLSDGELAKFGSQHLSHCRLSLHRQLLRAEKISTIVCST